MILIYNILILLIAIILLPILISIVFTSKKRMESFYQRMGLQDLPLPIHDKNPLWIHALSVGEVFAAVPLVKEMRSFCKCREIFLSVSTKTGHNIAKKELSGNIDALFFFPYDLLFSVKKIITKINPAIVVLVESDIWPNFMNELKQRRIPVVLVNARLSPQSFKGYQRFSFLMKEIFNIFSCICVQSHDEAEKFKKLGADYTRIKITGNIKFDQNLIFKLDDVNNLRDSLHIPNNSRIFLAGSTHKGEEVILKSIYLKLKNTFDDLIMIIVPRNPDRCKEIFDIFAYSKLSVSQMTCLDSSYNVLIVDIMGILSKLYALADITFVGGSLTDCGGHNPLEPAAFSKPVLFGPDMSDFPEISKMLVKAKGAFQVKDEDELFLKTEELLLDRTKAFYMGKQSFSVFNANKGALNRTVNILKNYLN
ncbi:3-deoxy-D-manno-octulosonic acid transferase [Candidatus Magnetomoraceae bacterium gMMP-1]